MSLVTNDDYVKT